MEILEYGQAPNSTTTRHPSHTEGRLSSVDFYSSYLTVRPDRSCSRFQSGVYSISRWRGPRTPHRHVSRGIPGKSDFVAKYPV